MATLRGDLSARVRSLDRRVIAITGGARGIGRSTAELLAGAGARVAIGDLDGDQAVAVASAMPGMVIGLALDVTVPSSFRTFFDEVEQRLGPVDVLVNNAGVMVVGPFVDEDDTATARELGVNVLGVVHGMRQAIPRMLLRGDGHIINIASLASWFCTPGEATYTATKHAVRGLTESVRIELADTPVQLTSIYPGVVDTELAAGTGSGALLAPEQVAQAVHDAIRHRKAEVFVPAAAGPIARLTTALRPRARRLLGHLLGVDKVATTVDPAERAGYEQRVAPRSG